MSSAPSRRSKLSSRRCGETDAGIVKKRLGRQRHPFRRTLVFACIPLVLVIRCLRPVLWIRFGWLQTHKIGHILLEPEFFLCERAAGIQPRNTIDLFFDRERADGAVCNTQAMAMVKRHLKVSPFVKYLWQANRRLPGADAHIVHIRARDHDSVRDRHGLFQHVPVQIDFTPEEHRRGRALLAQMGIPADAKYVCVHVRDALYWKSRDPKIGRNSDFRNCDINDFLPAIRALLARGYFVLRIGHPVGAPLLLDDARFIDYSTGFRSEFLDIYLGANCHFMISTGSGIDSIAYMFRRPILMCNIAPAARVFSDRPGIVNLPKLHRRRGELALMGFGEMVESGVGDFVNTDQFDSAGVEFMDSPPEVICGAALEMADRIDGAWQDSVEDQARHAAFWRLLRSHPLHGEIRGVISTVYLRAYGTLL
jgi:putative glycosyltransferase (TIGR04372 family)